LLLRIKIIEVSEDGWSQKGSGCFLAAYEDTTEQQGCAFIMLPDYATVVSLRDLLLMSAYNFIV
jgi:hypothetical protein